MDTKPIRYAEAPWVFNRRRYVRIVPSLKKQWWAGLSGVVVQGFIQFLQHHWMPAAVIIGGTVAAGGIAFFRNRLAWAFFREHYRAADMPEEVGMVTLELALDGIVYGRDLGFLTVDDHYVTFEGAQTTFSLSARHLSRKENVLKLCGFDGYTIEFDQVCPNKMMTTGSVPSTAEIEHSLAGLFDAPYHPGEVVGLPPLRPVRVSVANRAATFGLSILVPIVVFAFCFQIPSGFWIPLAIVLALCAFGFGICVSSHAYRLLKVERKFAKLAPVDP